jgi:hypothetical protein
VREEGRSHRVGSRLPNISQLLKALGERTIAAQDQVIDPNFESSPRFTRHSAREISGQGIAGNGNSEGFVQEFFRFGPALPLKA